MKFSIRICPNLSGASSIAKQHLEMCQGFQGRGGLFAHLVQNRKEISLAKDTSFSATGPNHRPKVPEFWVLNWVLLRRKFPWLPWKWSETCLRQGKYISRMATLLENPIHILLANNYRVWPNCDRRYAMGPPCSSFHCSILASWTTLLQSCSRTTENSRHNGISGTVIAIGNYLCSHWSRSKSIVSIIGNFSKQWQRYIMKKSCQKQEAKTMKMASEYCTSTGDLGVRGISCQNGLLHTHHWVW